jgi:phenylacetate-CoA ligase
MLESQRHPLLDEGARRSLELWREHPRAPRWNILCGDRLDQSGLGTVRDFARAVAAGPRWNSFGEPPDWAREFAAQCFQNVPFYRARGGSADDWASITPCDRLDLAREPWSFVPDGLGLDEMVVYTTSGTTGSEARIPAHQRWPSTYLPLLERALFLNGVDWARARAQPQEKERAALATIAAQEHTLTFAAWSSYLNGANLKVNLHPGTWRAPGDAAEFLNEADPQVLCGDPISLAELAATPFSGKPLAVTSSALHLSPRLKADLEARFSCPVVDVYGSNESGPLAASTYEGAMAVLPPDIWIEILRPDGTIADAGEDGEITITGGRNPFLPLLRYRTGDRARGQVIGGVPSLLNFHGRAPVSFDTGEQQILDIDVTHALRALPLQQFSLHQDASGALHFKFRGATSAAEIEVALRAVFPHAPLRIEAESALPAGERKLIRYSRQEPM